MKALKTLIAAAAILTGICLSAQDKLEIVKAEYGAGSSWADVTEIVASMVKADNQLEVEVGNTLFGNPASGVKKAMKLQVKYNGKPLSFMAYESSKFVLNKAILDKALASAAANQPVKKEFPKADPEQLKKIVIVKAEYGANDTWIDVTDKVQEQVMNGYAIIPVGNQLFGNPVSNTKKYMKIQYKYDGKDIAMKVDESTDYSLIPKQK